MAFSFFSGLLLWLLLSMLLVVLAMCLLSAVARRTPSNRGRGSRLCRPRGTPAVRGALEALRDGRAVR